MSAVPAPVPELAWADVRRRLREIGLRPSRRLGQNFLTDRNLLAALARDADVPAGQLALEVGPGPGLLTAELLRGGARVLAVELDRRLADLAAELLAPCVADGRLEVQRADVLEGKHAIAPAVRERLPRDEPWHVASNLPYSAASPALVGLARLPAPPSSMTVLVQAEVAERLVAEPGTRAWGPLGIRLRQRYRPRRLRTVPPELFWPRPQVESTLVRLELDPGSPAGEPELDALVGLLFRARRKAVGGVLGRALGDRGRVAALLEELGIDPRARPEELDLAGLRALASRAGDRLAPDPG